MQLPVVVQITNIRENLIVGDIQYDGETLETDAASLEPVIAFYREAGLSDEKIITKLAGWSNTVEVGQVVEGAI